MSSKIKDTRELNLALCEKLQPFLEPLSQKFGIQTFGYRKFYPDGMSVGLSTNHVLNALTIEKFNHNIIPSYETEVSLVLNNERSHFFRIGKPDKNNAFFSTLYDLDVWNTLSYYRKSGKCVEGFYYAATRSNEAIIEEYINNAQVFEMFSFYFKDKINSIIRPADLEPVKTETISPLIFENKHMAVSKDTLDIKNFISNIPVQKFFLSSNGQDYCLSIQEFKCLSLLSRGKTSKEVGVQLNISSRTVEGYIENIKSKIDVSSRSQLIDLFIANFKNDKNFIFPIEEEPIDKRET